MSSVAIAPDGRTALSGSCGQDAEALGPGQRKRAAHLHRALRLGEQRRHRPGRPNRVSGSRDKTLKLWDLASGKELRTFTGHSDGVTSVAIAPDGRTALSGSPDKTLKLWDLASGKELRTFTGHSDVVSSVAIAPDGRTALSGSS